MKNSAEEKVSKFYNEAGWESEKDITEDARRWEDLRENAKDYVSKCRLRILRHIPAKGENMLDMASGPIQYDEYLEFSRNFNKRYCIDLSSKALVDAKKRIGDHGVFLCGSFFNIDLDENFFDCSISLHTIYHMDKNSQEEAVRKLVSVTRPGKPVIIIYGNPDAFKEYLPGRLFKRLKRKIKPKTKTESDSDLYYYAHPVSWWKCFEDIAEVNILPWRSFNSKDQKKLIPDNQFGKLLFKILFYLEDEFPGFFSRKSQYPMIVLTKR